VSSNFADKRALIVEDEPVIALMLSDNLGELGFGSIEIAGTREQALKALRALEANPPQVVLLDLKLTDGDAAPVADLLRDRAVPFIFMSGNPGAASELGYAGVPVLGKPFSPADLQTALQQALG
jgi:CheY-like chemotaxis protein